MKHPFSMDTNASSIVELDEKDVSAVAGGAEKGAAMVTLAIWESGEGRPVFPGFPGLPIKPPVGGGDKTTLAMGEEGGVATTLAIGEEGGGYPWI